MHDSAHDGGEFNGWTYPARGAGVFLTQMAFDLPMSNDHHARFVAGTALRVASIALVAWLAVSDSIVNFISASET